MFILVTQTCQRSCAYSRLAFYFSAVIYNLFGVVDWLLIKERFLYARSRPTFYFSGINSLSINLLKIIDLSIKVHFCMPSRAQNYISGLLFINFLKVID